MPWPVRVLADQRFSSRYELKHYPLPGMEEVDELPPAPVGELTGIDPPTGGGREWTGTAQPAG
jgi:hypothetical protein